MMDTPCCHDRAQFLAFLLVRVPRLQLNRPLLYKMHHLKEQADYHSWFLGHWCPRVPGQIGM